MYFIPVTNGVSADLICPGNILAPTTSWSPEYFITLPVIRASFLTLVPNAKSDISICFAADSRAACVLFKAA